MSDLINADLLSDLEVYYGKIGGYDSLSCGDLLLRKKRSGGAAVASGEIVSRRYFHNWSSTWIFASILFFLKILEVPFYRRKEVTL